MQTLTQDFVAKFRGDGDAKQWAEFTHPNIQLLGESARELLRSVPPSFGSCAMLSSTWVAYLREKLGIPAIAVAGDLVLNNIPIFVCDRNLPDGHGSGLQDHGQWKGHCWVAIGGYIGDISLFRSAYAVNPNHLLSQFIRREFGEGRGAVVAHYDDLKDSGIEYKPKYVLTDEQINSLWAGLGYLLSNGG